MLHKCALAFWVQDCQASIIQGQHLWGGLIISCPNIGWCTGNLSYREVKTLIHNTKKAIFHCKTGGYNPYQDALHQPPRHQQTTIFCLKTGHCRLKSLFKRIGVKTSAQCPCGDANQTPEHYLQSCSLHQQVRHQMWPTCVSLKTKLWGSVEDLFLTSKYAALTEEWI